LTSSYTGNLLNVINAGGTPADIGYTGSNELNTSALLAHTGTGGADTGRIVRVYGQVGTLDGYQGTAANSPWIVQAGAINTIGTRPGCKPQTASAGLFTVTTAGTAPTNLHGAQDDFTLILVVIGPTDSNTRDVYRSGGNGAEVYGFEPNAGGGRARIDPSGGVVVSATGANVASSNPRIFAYRRLSGNGEIWRTPGATLVAGPTAAAVQFTATFYNLFSGPTDRTYAEFYWWNSALSNAEILQLMTNCQTFYGATYP
jgi:hypothetical protein